MQRSPAVVDPLADPGPALVHPLLRTLRWTGGPERVFESLLDALPASDLRPCVDIGANIGTFSNKAAAHGHSVVAFEPIATNIAAFRMHNAAHMAKIKLVTKGVGDRLSVFTMRGNAGGASAKMTIANGTQVSFDVGATVTQGGCDSRKYVCQTIHVTTLDDELASVPSIVAAKLDIQGFETNAFRGALRLLARRAVDVFVIEFDPKLQDMQRGSCEEIMLLLRGAGYVFFEGAIIKKGTYKPIRASLGVAHSLTDYVDMLRQLNAYTDLVAIRCELVPRLLLNLTGTLPEAKRAAKRQHGRQRTGGVLSKLFG